MTSQWEPDAEVLGRRYQRLLAWYPPRHRAAHGEEMLGVLLAAAPDGQRRPRLTEAVNLIWGGLLIWLRPRPAVQATSGWSDALAVFSVAAPLALALQYFAVITASGPSVSARGGARAVLIGLAYRGLTLALPFVLLGLRRTAGFICCAVALLLALMAGNSAYLDLFEGGAGGSFAAVIFFSYATEAGALLGSPGPRRGWRILSWRGWLLIGVAATAAGLLQGAIGMGRMVGIPGSPYRLPHHVSIAGWLALASGAAVVIAIAAGAARRSALGRRLLALFAIPAWPWLVTRIWYGPENPVEALLVTYVPALILVGLVLARIRRDRRSVPDGGQPARA
jgi:hypothetical protein